MAASANVLGAAAVVASGFGISEGLGALAFLAILLHKLPEGLATSSLFVAAGESRGRAWASIALAVSRQ